MSIIAKLAVKNLKANKGQTKITILGVILATAMICGLISLIASFQNFFYLNALASYGSWHVEYKHVTEDQVKEQLQDPELANVFKLEDLGYAKVENYNQYKPYLYLAGLEKDYVQSDNLHHLFPINILEGRLPANEHEIILPSHLKGRTKENLKLGDELNLSLGRRELNEAGASFGTEDGEAQGPQKSPQALLGQSDQLRITPEGDLAEQLVQEAEASYKLVGFYERSDLEPYEAPGYMALTLQGKSEGLGGKNHNPNNYYNFYLELKHPSGYEDFIARHSGAEGASVNRDLLRYRGLALNDEFTMTLYSLGGIFLLIIIFGSVILINNAFTISLSERVKQFGLLSSVGTSAKQLRKCVLTEAFLICLIGLPIGILGGLLGIKVTLLAVRDLLEKTSMINNSVVIDLKVSWPALIFAGSLSLLTVLFSAYWPAYKSSKIPAIEAIRQSREIVNRPVKTGKLARKIFPVPAYLASKYYKLSKRKYRSTVVGLALSIVLFLSAFTFSKLLSSSAQGIFTEEGADVVYSVRNENLPEQQRIDLDEGLKLLSQMEGSASVHGQEVYQSYFVLDKSSINDRALNLWEKGESELGLQDLGDDHFLVNLSLVFLPDADFSAYLVQSNIKPEDYKLEEGGRICPLVLNQTVERSASGSFLQYDFFKEGAKAKLLQIADQGDYKFAYIAVQEGKAQAHFSKPLESEATEKSIDLAEASPSESDLSFKYFSQKRPDHMASEWRGLTLFLPASSRAKLIENPDRASYGYAIETTANGHKKFLNQLDELSTPLGNAAYYHDIKSTREASQSTVAIVNIFCYGFICLISLIALTNVFNTVTTNIRLRSRDFAMLESLGMSKRDFRQMALFESLLYGTRSIIFGLPLALGFSFLIQIAVNQSFDTGLFIPWQAILLAMIVIFIFIILSILYSMHKMKAKTLLESLKSELN